MPDYLPPVTEPPSDPAEMNPVRFVPPRDEPVPEGHYLAQLDPRGVNYSQTPKGYLRVLCVLELLGCLETQPDGTRKLTKGEAGTLVSLTVHNAPRYGKMDEMLTVLGWDKPLKSDQDYKDGVHACLDRRGVVRVKHTSSCQLENGDWENFNAADFGEDTRLMVYLDNGHAVRGAVDRSRPTKEIQLKEEITWLEPWNAENDAAPRTKSE